MWFDEVSGNSPIKTVDGSRYCGRYVRKDVRDLCFHVKRRKPHVRALGRQRLPPDLDKLYSILHEAHKDLSRFDVYKSEIEAGHLQWGLVHTEKFFKENARLMEGPDGDFALVKVSRIGGCGRSMENLCFTNVLNWVIAIPAPD